MLYLNWYNICCTYLYWSTDIISVRARNLKIKQKLLRLFHSRLKDGPVVKHAGYEAFCKKIAHFLIEKLLPGAYNGLAMLMAASVCCIKAGKYGWPERVRVSFSHARWRHAVFINSHDLIDIVVELWRRTGKCPWSKWATNFSSWMVLFVL